VPGDRLSGGPCEYLLHRVSQIGSARAYVGRDSFENPTDAIIRVTSACVCGSDLWPHADLEPTETGRTMGHEAIGGSKAVRVPLADGTLYVLPCGFDDALMPSLLTLSGVLGTGHRAMADRESIKVLVKP
jgi:Alcohol dehydrogenase GroES-like domain